MTIRGHSAPGSAAGYAYQFERALNWLAQKEAGSCIGVETDDDIAVHNSDSTTLLEQDKHSVREGTHPFDDRSHGLWNTLATWIEAIDSGKKSIEATSFLMVTNTVVPECVARRLARAQSDEEIAACIAELEKISTDPPNHIATQIHRVLLDKSSSTLRRVIRAVKLSDASDGAASENLRRKKVILWPKDASLSPRIVPFEPGRINVISGESGTGKSTITWIIDYCLGSDKCSIPVGLIRNVTEWFGIHIKLLNTEMLIARRNPGDRQTTTDLYWAEGLQLDVPAMIAGKNARVEDLKNRFNQLSDLPSLDFVGGEDVGFAGRPSFRDMASFNFQPQHIVANPYTFFYKADTTENREKLKIIFPLALGTITASTLTAQRGLKDLEREHERLRRELDARLAAAKAWEAEVESYYLQARGLGLVPNSEAIAPDWSLEKYILELRKVPTLVQSMDIPDVGEGTNEAAAVEFTRVADEEDQLAQETGLIRRRLDKIEQLSMTLSHYGSDLVSQEDRLQGVGWFGEKLQDTHVCPVCAAVHSDGNTHLAELQTLAQEMKTLTSSIHQAPAKLDRELAALRVELREKEALLGKARQKRKYLETQSATLAAQRQRVRQIYLFVGRVQQVLENVSTSSNVDDLRKQLQQSASAIALVRRELDPKSQADRLRAAVDSVSAGTANYARLLQLEHAAENVRLNLRELTLQFSPLSGRTDFLWEVGSGQNWVGYHVAGMLALHQHFLGMQSSPVANFLVIDQPSQVYFPEAWPSMEQTPDAPGKADRSPDIEGVHRIFAAFSAFLDAVSTQFQIIVTEHAGSITWRGVPHVHLVGNWRLGHDQFLIPNTWTPRQ